MIIGIDIGTTTTKAVSIEDGTLTQKIKTKAFDAVTAATGAFGKMILENKIKIEDVEEILITGAGASKIDSNIFGIPTSRVSEIEAIGIGGMFLSGMNEIIITNIGTGTVIVETGSRGIVHFGGSGVGGGTILGLAKGLLPVSEFTDIMELAKTGNISQTDLLLEDIMDTGMSFLDREATAANFGKMLDTSGPGDIALAIINMVYQVIGVLSVFAARARNTREVIVTGNGSDNIIGQKILSKISIMYNTEFIYPEHAEYTTAIGAGLYNIKNLKNLKKNGIIINDSPKKGTKMDKTIKPFIDVCKNVFKELVGTTLHEGRPYFVESGAVAEGDISAIIGLTGEARGAVVISMKTDVAAKITDKLTGTSHGGLDDDVVDAIGEIVNIISGNVKKSLENDFRLVISLPSIVQGQNHIIRWPGIQARFIRIPFKIFNNSTFYLSVAIESV